MSQNRKAPAYQEYAATILTQLPFRIMSLQDRGLLYTMRLECWVNQYLPNNHEDLAKIIGCSAAEVTSSLSAVMPFFQIQGNFIICPELEDYRAHLEVRKLKQSQGGKTGSAITNDKRRLEKNNIDEGSTNSSSNSQVPRQVPRRGSDESLVQLSTVKQSQVQSSREKDLGTDEFISEYNKYSETYEAEQDQDQEDAQQNSLVPFVKFDPLQDDSDIVEVEF